MKKFENKKISITDNQEEMYYADLIKQCINFIPKGFEKEGWSPSLQKESFRIEDALEKAKPEKIIEIEDHDITLIKKFCSDFPWAIRHRELVDFDEYIKSL